MESNSDVLRSAPQVWDYLKSNGGLDLKNYDSQLEDDLRCRLRLPAGKDFRQSLRSTGISVESFVIAFFQAVAPFAMMLSDLLETFEKADAHRGSTNIVISFKFNEKLPPLQFDLTQFRDWIETWRRITGPYLEPEWNNNVLWMLNSVVCERFDVLPNDQAARRWVNQYMQDRVWPGFQLPPPRSGEPQLDESLRMLWTIWSRVVDQSSTLGRSREVLRNLGFGLLANQVVGQDASGSAVPSARILAGIDSDHWAGSLASGAYVKAETLAALPTGERRDQANKLQAELQHILSQVPTTQAEGPHLSRKLEEVLQHPIWKQRPALYSAWVFTRILEALDGLQARVHQMNDTIAFSFSGTHLATFDAVSPKLHLWAELRSPVDNPVGHGRSGAIQPDYSLVIDPISDPNAAVLVIECKQYLRPSRRNFSNALTDYARGRPNSLILLVNYGPARQGILDGVPPDVRDRTAIIGDFKPTSTAAKDRFKEIVKNTVRQRLALNSPNPDPKTKPALPIEGGMVTLSWAQSPRDLDLHLRITSGGVDQEISFSKMGRQDAEPWAELKGDVQTGHGPELISLAKWLNVKYHFAVHNYSGEVPLAGSGATIEFIRGQQRMRFQCPTNGAGDWWSVFAVDGESGEIEVFNRLLGTPWRT
jgi:hypothetical protein